jgi:hypothetical protein
VRRGGLRNAGRGTDEYGEKAELGMEWLQDISSMLFLRHMLARSDEIRIAECGRFSITALGVFRNRFVEWYQRKYSALCGPNLSAEQKDMRTMHCVTHNQNNS